MLIIIMTLCFGLSVGMISGFVLLALLMANEYDSNNNNKAPLKQDKGEN